MGLKHDWDSLFKEFVASEYTQAKAFLREEKGFFKVGNNSSAQEKIKGWTKRKKEIKEAQTAKVVEKMKTEIGLTTEALLTSKWNCIKILNNRLRNAEELTIRDLETIIRIIKTELYEPTNITQGKMETKLDATEKFKEVVINFIDAD